MEWTDLSFPRHCHSTFEAVFIKSGEIELEKEGVVYKLKQNDAMVIMPFETHAFLPGNTSQIFTLQLSVNQISNFTEIFKNKVPKNPICHFSQGDMDDIYLELKTIDSMVDINYTFFRIMRAVLCNNELVSFFACNDLFKQAIIYLSNHFDESLSLAHVAKKLNVSRVHLSRMFSHKSQLGFTNCVNGLRVQKAITMLSNTSLAVSDIGLSCGFGSIRSFNRVFSEMMSCTPSEYRRKNILSVDKNA